MNSVSKKGTLKNHALVYNTIKKVKINVQNEIENHQALKNDIELTRYIANGVENEIPYKSKNINKKNIVMEVHKQLFPDITEDELKGVESSIEFLLNNKMIKKTSWLYKGLKFFLNLLKKA